MHLTLFDWGPSPFSIKLRAILDYKGLSYTRKSVLDPKVLKELRSRGKVGKAPALDIDGTLFVDTTNIAYEIERRVPSSPVIPSDVRERALCHAIEEWADESLYFVGLYYQWFEAEGAKRVPQAFGKSLFGRAAYLFFRAKVLKQIEGQGTSRKTPEHVRADLERHFDALEGLVHPGPYMFGDAPRLCDFAVLGQLVYLGRTPVGGQALAGRTGIQTYLERFKALRANVQTPRS